MEHTARGVDTQRLDRVPTTPGAITRLACARAREAGIALEPLLQKAGLTVRQAEDLAVRLPVRAHKILDELRSDLAKRHIKDKDLSISEIAWLVGYQEVSAFTHAFKRWTGRTPTEMQGAGGPRAFVGTRRQFRPLARLNRIFWPLTSKTSAACAATQRACRGRGLACRTHWPQVGPRSSRSASSNPEQINKRMQPLTTRPFAMPARFYFHLVRRHQRITDRVGMTMPREVVNSPEVLKKVRERWPGTGKLGRSRLWTQRRAISSAQLRSSDCATANRYPIGARSWGRRS